MGRETRTVVIDAVGRDNGRTFFLTEMPAAQAEKWAMRAFLAMARNGVQIPDDLASRGLAGIAAVGLQALGSMAFADAESLMDEMFACIQVIPDPNRPGVKRALIDTDIDEIPTRLFLRKQILDLHVSFIKVADLLGLASPAAVAENAPSTKTSHKR